MSNDLPSLETESLEAVTGGASTPRCGGSNDQTLATLTSLSSTISDLGKNASRGNSLSPTEAMMFGLLLSRRNTQVNVIVRRPFW